MTFADAFAFSRPTAAPYVDAAGVTRIAAAGQPRFDYAARGKPLGLLVEAGDALGQGDHAVLVPRDWSAADAWTIVHDWSDDAGRRTEAHYARDPAAMIDGCLAAVGRHRRIAAFAGYLPNHGGWVWALGQRWTLPAVLGTRDGAEIVAGKLLIGS